MFQVPEKKHILGMSVRIGCSERAHALVHRDLDLELKRVSDSEFLETSEYHKFTQRLS